MRFHGLLRIGNCTMALFGVFIGAIVEVFPLDLVEGVVGLKLPLPGTFEVPLVVPVVLAALVAFLVTGAGNALNDFYDRDVDRKAHPERPIPSGDVTPLSAWRFSMALFGLGVILSVIINWWCFIIAVVNSLLLLGYEKRIKAKGLPGNVMVSYLTASVFLFGGAAVSQIQVGMVLFLLAFLANTGREIAKDIQDMEGDRAQRRTFPMKVGARSAAKLAGGFVVVAVMLSMLPLVGNFGGLEPTFEPGLYLPVVIAADVMFIYSCSLLFKRPAASQKMMKTAMVVAMVAFLLGGLLWIP